jgi:hypothetical protein
MAKLVSLFVLFILLAVPFPAAATPDDHKVERVALTYSVEVSRKGKPAGSSAKPAEGDRIKFQVQPSVDGYMYIVAANAGDGEYDVLFPKGKESNAVSRRNMNDIVEDTVAGDALYVNEQKNRVGDVFVEELRLTRPAGSEISRVSQSPGFKDKNAITVEVPEISEDHPLELELTF